VFAYGQTSSGKTYTMRGADESSSMGIIPLCMRQIYHEIEQVRVCLIIIIINLIIIYEFIRWTMSTRRLNLKRQQSLGGDDGAVK